MARSISFCEPSVVLAGEVGTFRFIYTPGTNLPKGTLLRFDLASKGRRIDWQTPDPDLKSKENLIFAFLENGKILTAKPVEVPSSVVPQFQFVLPCDCRQGQNITIVLGAMSNKEKEQKTNGNLSQLTVQRRRPFHLYVDPTGKGNFQDPETFFLDVKGNELKSIRIVAPSVTSKNRRFDVVLRFEDEYGNLTSNAPDGTLIELTHDNLRENLKWKLFVPETGFMTLPNLYFNEPGVYTIELKNVQTNETFYSSPIKCFAQEVRNLFWGLLHGESERFDSTESIESCIRHFRDEKSVNFFASSSFESAEETSNEMWKTISQNVEEFDENDRFTTFLGFQWEGEIPQEGLRQIIYAKDDKPLLRKKDPRTNTLKKIYKLYSPKDIISIPTFTMAKGHDFDFQDFCPEFERVVEIYNAWGSSETTAKDHNPKPICGTSKNSIKESQEGSLVKALLKNRRFGFVAGGLDDRGIYEELYDCDQEQYSPGLTGIYAEELSRSSMFEALYQRQCFATTGERIILGLNLAGQPMGSELDTLLKPGLHINRHLAGFVAGCSPLLKVELIRNGKVLTTFTPKDDSFDFEYDDLDPLSKVLIDAKDKKPPFIFYYLRVTQKDGHMAWSSPIWVDCTGTLASVKPVRKTTVKSAKELRAALVKEDFNEEDAEEDFDEFDEEETEI